MRLARSIATTAAIPHIPVSAHGYSVPPALHATHRVQFYEDEGFLANAIADHLGSGLAAGQPILVVATEPHRVAVVSRLAEKGMDPSFALHSGQLVMVDARETLGKFMDGVIPDPARFRSAVGGLIELLIRDRPHTVCAYGEMVDLLWKEGNREGAIRLEELWNDLARTYSFSLLCAYAMSGFFETDHAEQLREICQQHAHVLPTEQYLATDETARLIEITLLQQRARALETEVNHRKALERSLREALAERERSEQALRRSEEELKDFLDNAVEGIHWVGPDGTILWANQTELDLLGYEAHEYIGRNIAQFHVDPLVVEDMLARLSRNETLREYEARVRCKDGSTKDVLVASNVLWRDGAFVHTRCFTRDVTELKRATAERERLLESERMARAEAEAANKAKSEFLAVMSHELRTPLNAIGGHVQLIEMGLYGTVTDSQRTALERVQRSQRHLLSLISSVLNLTRIERGHVEYALEDVDLQPLLAESLAMVEPLLAARQLTCEVVRGSSAGDEIRAIADREKLPQILLNLLTNAIKFTPAGGHITLGVDRAVDAAPPMLCVHVSDTGIGIPDEKLESVFEPFVQLATRAIGQQEGVGLGLAISRDLARGMGGDLSASSKPGAGSVFTVTLPAAGNAW